MPLVDYPLVKLRDYRGCSPLPPDFDAYWQRGLDELAALPSDYELEQAAFQVPAAECHHLHWQGVAGARLHAKYLRPRVSGKSAPCVILFHGYSGSSGDWADKLAWVALGFSVLAMDVRGQAGLSDGGGSTVGKIQAGLITRGLAAGADQLYFRNVYLDCCQIARIAMQLPGVDATRVFAMGASQGGALPIACAALEPRVAAVVSLYPFLSDYRRVWEMDLSEGPYEDLRRWFREYDPQHLREEWFFTQLGYIDIQNLAPRVRSRVLMGTGLMDRICPPSTQFAIFNKLECGKRMIIYPDFGHELIKGWSDEAMQFLLAAS
jgi:cephalosporin-C deacetylase